MRNKTEQKTLRQDHARAMAQRVLHYLCEMRDVASSNAKASWMPDDEVEYWDTIEIKSESIRSEVDSLIEVIRKGA